MNSPPQSQAAGSGDEFPCQNCGAKLTYDAGAQALKCPYCGTQQAIPQRRGREGPPGGARDPHRGGAAPRRARVRHPGHAGELQRLRRHRQRLARRADRAVRVLRVAAGPRAGRAGHRHPARVAGALQARQGGGQRQVRGLAGRALVPPQRPEEDGEAPGDGGRLHPLLDVRRLGPLRMDRRRRLLLLRDRGVHRRQRQPRGPPGAAHPLDAGVRLAGGLPRRHAGVRLQGPAAGAGGRVPELRHQAAHPL